MFAPGPMGYDRAITIFSPDGRLFQVEYAFEAVKKGWTTLGIKGKDGVVLAVEKRQVSPLMEGMEKIKKIDEHVGLAFAGLSSDARILIDQARLYAQIHRLVYGEPIPIELLAKRICDIKQAYTQHGGVRPFGVSFLIAGVDATAQHLIGTDPGGTYVNYKAHAIGSGGPSALEVLEKNYKDDLSLDEAIALALMAMDKAIDGGVTVERVEIAYVDMKEKMFKKLSTEELEKIITGLKR